MLYIQLFWSFFQVGLFSIGGGYASIPLIQNQVVDIHHWLTLKEFTDLVTISGMTPGPIAINSSTFVGIQIAGFLGAFIATLGCILPSCIIVMLLAFIYRRYKNLLVIHGILNGLRPAVVALIASAGVTILINALWGETVTSFSIKNMDYIAILLFGICLLILRKVKMNPIYVLIGSGIVGMILYLIFHVTI